MRIKGLCAVFLILLSPSITWSNPAFHRDDVTVKMEVFAERGLILFNVTNKNTYPVIVNFMVGDLSQGSGGLENAFIALDASSRGTKEIKFSLVEDSSSMAFDYDINYRERNTRKLFTAYNPTQYFVKSGSAWRPVDVHQFNRSMLKQDIRQLPEEIENSRLEFGANFSAASTINVKDFRLDPNDVMGDEDDEYSQMPIDLLPQQLADVLPIGALPQRGTLTSEGNVRPPLNLEKNKKQASLNPPDPDSCLKDPRCLQGNLRFRGSIMSPSYSVWGWRVTVYDLTHIPGKFIGTTETDSTGYWTMNIPANRPVRESYYVTFSPINRFLEVREPVSDKLYQWGKYIKPQTLNHSVIFRQASMPGIDAIFSAANQLWVKLVNNGINPLHTKPTIIYFPNALDKNGDSPCTFGEKPNQVAWSCSNGVDFWLIPDHADKGTVVHEMGHVLNLMYWGAFPTGSGGDHVLGQCYTKGLALSEGFANFLQMWAQSTATTQNSIGWNLENFTSSCTTLNASFNELSVAATMWDLYDSVLDQRAESDYVWTDNIHFTGDGGTVAEFLSAKDVNNSSQFMNALMNKYPDYKDYLSDVFGLNATSK